MHFSLSSLRIQIFGCMHAFFLIRLCEKIFGCSKTFCIIGYNLSTWPTQVALDINIRYNMFPALSKRAIFAQCALIRLRPATVLLHNTVCHWKLSPVMGDGIAYGISWAAAILNIGYWVRPTDAWTFSVVHLCDASMGSSEVIGSLLASAILICGRAAFK